MPASKHSRKGKTQTRAQGAYAKMPWFPPLSEEEGDTDAAPPIAADLLDWRPRVVRRVDERQGDLFDGRTARRRRGRTTGFRDSPHGGEQSRRRRVLRGAMSSVRLGVEGRAVMTSPDMTPIRSMS